MTAPSKRSRSVFIPLIIAGLVLFAVTGIYYLQARSQVGMKPGLSDKVHRIGEATAKDGRTRSFLGTDSTQVIILVPLAKQHEDRLIPALLEEVATAGATLETYELDVYADDNGNGKRDADEPSVHWETSDPKLLMGPMQLDAKPLGPELQGKDSLLYELRIRTSKEGNSLSFSGRVQTQDEVDAILNGQIGT
ncbi:MAG: hypothetical protein H6830_12515 [Planctomycetes bacterium]|nr:hypothetical protein [Planctomycetota bacterium]